MKEIPVKISRVKPAADGRLLDLLFLLIRELLLLLTTYQRRVYPPTDTYPTKREKENHLQNCLGRGYVRSQEGIFFHSASELIRLLSVVSFVA